MIELAIGILIIVTFLVFSAALTASRQKPVSLTERLKSSEGAASSGSNSLRDKDEMKKSFFNRVILPASEKLGKRFPVLTPDKMVNEFDILISQAGMIGKVAGSQLTTLTFILTLGLPVLLFILFLPHMQKGNIDMGTLVLICVFSCILGFRLPKGMLQSRAKSRAKEIQLSLPFTMDLISISVTSGMAFEGAMQIVSERTKGALSDEFKITLREINLGIARSDALVNLSKRSGVDDLKSFITAVNYISKLGGNLADVIKIQTEAMRVKRRQRAEKAANQAPVKIMVPLILFIFPCLFMVILGPAVAKIATYGTGL